MYEEEGGANGKERKGGEEKGKGMIIIKRTLLALKML